MADEYIHKRGLISKFRPTSTTVFRRKLAGLPDGLISNQKSQFGKIGDSLKWENVDIFYEHLEYFTDIWDILRPIGTFCVYLVHFYPVLVSCTKKIWQP
jgi:hypothetical protein